MPNFIVDNAAFSGKNATSAVEVYNWTATKTGKFQFRLRLTNAAGNGNYTAHLTRQIGGAGTVFPIVPKATYAAAVGETAFSFASLSLIFKSGDKIGFDVLGLAGDNALAGNVDVIEDDALVPVVAGQNATAVDGSGAVTFNNTSIGLTAAAVQAIWDALTAGLTAVGSIGKFIVGALGGTFFFPAGAIAFTYTVTDSVTGLPLDGVQVWFSTDVAGANVVWSGVTDAFGIARDVNLNLPHLNAGTYYVWRQLAGYVFADPDSEVVS